MVLDIGSISEKLNKFFKVIFKMRRLKYVELVSCKKIKYSRGQRVFRLPIQWFQAPNSPSESHPHRGAFGTQSNISDGVFAKIVKSSTSLTRYWIHLCYMLRAKIVQNVGSVSQELCIVWSSFVEHMCKRIISPGFLHFFNFDCWGQ